jgi:transposase
MGGITMFSGPKLRRRWNDEDRARILEQAFALNACVAEVAHQNDVSAGLLHTWRQKLRREPAVSDFVQAPGFVEAVDSDTPALPAMTGAAVVIEMVGGGRGQISASTPPGRVSAVLKALRGDLTLAESGAKHGIHHTMIAAWKRQAINGMASTFADASEVTRASGEAETDKQHSKIGQLVVERDFLAKTLWSMSVDRCRRLIEAVHAELAILVQCRLL